MVFLYAVFAVFFVYFSHYFISFMERRRSVEKSTEKKPSDETIQAPRIQVKSFHAYRCFSLPVGTVVSGEIPLKQKNVPLKKYLTDIKKTPNCLITMYIWCQPYGEPEYRWVYIFKVEYFVLSIDKLWVHIGMEEKELWIPNNDPETTVQVKQIIQGAPCFRRW
jgi:hypothetical protein